VSTIIDGHEDEIDGMNGLELWLSDIATDSATRNLGAVMIGIGGLLGMVIGIMLISGNVSDILSGQMEESGGTADIDGIVISELVGNSSGGDGVEGVEVTLFDEEELEVGTYVTDSSGRFSISDVPRRTVLLEIEHPGNVTVRISLIPGDHSQISVTLIEGDGPPIQLDMTGESHLDESVLIATIFAVFALLTGLAGIAGALEANKGGSYRKTWWLSFLSLWSGGMIFVGPLFTLSGMGLVGLSRNQFYDVYSKED
jgi:hypothetical protein